MLPRPIDVKTPPVSRHDLLGDDLDGERDLDLAVEADRDLVGAQRLDRFDQSHAPPTLWLTYVWANMSPEA